MRIGRFAAISIAILVAPVPVVAQSTEHALSGVVREAGSGAPVAGAVVTVRGATVRTIRTDALGAWSIGGLAAGEYAIEAAHPGYARRAVEARVPYDASVRLALTPSPLALNGVVATASRRLQTLSQAVVATEVVGRDEIERSGAADLSAILVEQTGIQLQGGHPTGAGIMLQGLGQERVLVLLDGQPFIGRIGGELDLSRIPASMVERVEVVKGPQSTLYGSEAMGGVINVITRAPRPGGWGAGRG